MPRVGKLHRSGLTKSEVARQRSVGRTSVRNIPAVSPKQISLHP